MHPVRPELLAFASSPASLLVGKTADRMHEVDEVLSQPFRLGRERILRTVRIDKPGQMHVVATDGAIYTAGEVWWLRGQLRTVAQACVAGRNEIAATRLVDVQSILQSHQAHLPE